MTCWTQPDDPLNGTNMTTNGSTSVPSNLCLASPQCRLVRSAEMWICCILGIAGFVGNVISVFVLQRQKVKTSNVFLLQLLCIVDAMLMLTSTVSASHYIWEFITYCQANSISRSIVVILFDILQFTSNWLLVQLAVDRYIAICMPFSANRWCNVSKAKRGFLLIVIFSILINIYRAVELFRKSYVRLPISYSVINITFRYLLQIVILLVINTKLIIVIRRAQETEPGIVVSLRDKASQNSSLRHANSVTINLIVVVIIFLVCGTCRGIFFILFSTAPHVFRGHASAYFLSASITSIMMVFNSSINFVVYCLFYKKFRTTVTEMFCRGIKKSNCTDISMTEGRSMRTTLMPICNGNGDHV